jgi:chloramphenicol O-acetyltransferase type A
VRVIDQSTWPRRSHLRLFSSYAVPYTSLVAPVDVTPLVRAARARGLGLFKPLLWAASRAANRVPELRQRIRGAEVVEHDVVHPSYTTLTEGEVFNYCTVAFAEEPAAFFAAVEAESARVAGVTELVPDAPERDDLLFMSSIPWRRITALTHPVPLDPPDSFPRIAWGKAHGDDAVALDVGLMAHHGLVDGVHMARFYAEFEAAAAAFAEAP